MSLLNVVTNIPQYIVRKDVLGTALSKRRLKQIATSDDVD
jgi:hypothetical protein